MTRMVKRACVVSLVLVLTILSTVAPDDLDKAKPTEIIIIGTLHGSHNTNENYSPDHVKRILLALKLDLILVELPPTIVGGDGKPHETAEKDGRISKDLLKAADDFPEFAATDEAAHDLNVRQVPYDREGRNELYRETKYLERREQVRASLDKWCRQLEKDEPEAIALKNYRMLMDAVIADYHLKMFASPKVINSEAYDRVTCIKHTIFSNLIPMILAPSSRHKDLVEEIRFITDEMAHRDTIMADNIVRIAAQFPGKRLAVTTGAEHRYILRDLLSKKEGIVLKEFWEVLP